MPSVPQGRCPLPLLAPLRPSIPRRGFSNCADNRGTRREENPSAKRAEDAFPRAPSLTVTDPHCKREAAHSPISPGRERMFHVKHLYVMRIRARPPHEQPPTLFAHPPHHPGSRRIAATPAFSLRSQKPPHRLHPLRIRAWMQPISPRATPTWSRLPATSLQNRARTHANATPWHNSTAAPCAKRAFSGSATTCSASRRKPSV